MSPENQKGPQSMETSFSEPKTGLRAQERVLSAKIMGLPGQRVGYRDGMISETACPPHRLQTLVYPACPQLPPPICSSTEPKAWEKRVPSFLPQKDPHLKPGMRKSLLFQSCGPCRGAGQWGGVPGITPGILTPPSRALFGFPRPAAGEPSSWG